MNNKTTKNYIYNLIFQIFTILTPLLTTPYISRVLENDGVGRYSFAFTVMSYFHLFANLGFNSYAQRLIAQHQGDKEKQTKSFWEIIILRSIIVILVLSLYYLCILFEIFDNSYSQLFFILSINIIDTIFDIAFYFRGNEQFSKIVIRNIIIKIISIACIFIFVNNKSDIWIYTLIQSLTIILGNISLWIYMPKELVTINNNILKPFSHLKSCLILFIPTIATSIYTLFDKLLIGLLVDGTMEVILDNGSIILKSLAEIEIGNYEYAEKLVKIALTIITSLGIVMLPNNTKSFEDNNIKTIKNNIYNSSRFVWIIGIPIMLGLISISNNLIPWYLGEGYTLTITLMKILSVLILAIGLSNVLGIQYLLPSKKDKEFTIAIVIGAISNLILNLILIPLLNSIGAAIATILAEIIITIVMALFVKKDLNIYKIIIPPWKSLVAGIIMFIICFLLGSHILISSPLNTLIIILIGIVVYFALLLLFKEINIADITLFIKNIFKKDEN